RLAPDRDAERGIPGLATQGLILVGAGPARDAFVCFAGPSLLGPANQNLGEHNSTPIEGPARRTSPPALQASNACVGAASCRELLQAHHARESAGYAPPDRRHGQSGMASMTPLKL